MHQIYFFLLALAGLAGCGALTPNHVWHEGAVMSYEVLEIGPQQYKLVATGAGLHKQEAVERGFLFRAGQLCGGQTFAHEYQTAPFTHTLLGPRNVPTAYTTIRTSGIVKCK